MPPRSNITNFLLSSSSSRRPAGSSLHLGWCHVTERPWSHNPSPPPYQHHCSITSSPRCEPTSDSPFLPLSSL
ncbi:hypothetical protein PBY51_006498 [Eleginops maclovinus]|uniref:Uncharacterized protein n=1 Tax=Eleginops maclovinus TaxID=56733 RepID=A0AAN7X019_ELEMC|nr:hypothetical protein PBY51_006498 [Eleginops maclovinus]